MGSYYELVYTMYMNRRLYLYIFSIICVVCSAGASVQAASISVSAQSSTVQAGDTRILSVVVDTEGKEINAIEGTVFASDPIGEVFTGGSVFTLWPTVKKTSPTSFEFVGGTPSAVFGNKIKVLSFEVRVDTDASVEVRLKNIVLFVSDGKGSTISVPPQKILLSVGSGGTTVNETTEFLQSDTRSPMLSVTPIRDSDLYGEDVVLALDAMDTQSGIAYFQIREGSVVATTSATVYRLQNKEYTGRIQIKAFDKAGNSVTTYVRLYPSHTRYYVLVGLGVVLLLVFVIGKRYRKKHIVL